jgi:hypothetical protein
LAALSLATFLLMSVVVPPIALPGKLLGGVSVYLVGDWGYSRFFATTAMMGIPVALLCLLVWRVSTPQPRVVTSG